MTIEASMPYASPGRAPGPGRRFRSVCDVCLREVPGEVALDGDVVHLSRRCPEHGERRTPMSKNGMGYLKLDHSYHVVFPSEEKPPASVDTCFFITNACNQACEYCAVEANTYEYFENYRVEDFERDLANYSGAKVSLIGGEPFKHPSFFELVRKIEASGKTTVVYTNGIALADEANAKRLFETSGGRCEVRMTFEGFDEADYEHLRIPRLKEKKLAALANLSRLGVSATLGHTIAPEVQHDRARVQRIFRSLIEYGMEQPFVRGITFQGTAALGGSRFRSGEELLSVDHVMDEIVAASPVPMKRRDVYLSQRIVHLLARIFDLPMCSYVQAAVLFKTDAGWVAIDHFFDCDALERRLDARLARGRAGRAKMLGDLVADLLASARPAHVVALARIGTKLLRVFANRYEFSSIPATILPLISITVCDAHNLDSSVARRCEKSVHTRREGQALDESCSDMMLGRLRERVAGDARVVSEGSLKRPRA